MQFQVQAAAQISLPASQIQHLLDAGAQAEGSESAQELRCCGWFDSSYELSAGLLVIEDNAGSICFAD